MIFRKLKPSESTTYREIRLEALQTDPVSFGVTYEEALSVPKLDFERYIEEEYPGKFIIGAFVNEKLAGFCGFVQEDRIKTKHRGNIIQLFVKPEFRKQNIGKNLMIEIIKEAFKIPEIEQIGLSVVDGNNRAYKLYEELGFVQFGLHNKYFKDNGIYYGEHFMLLEKK